MISLSVSAKKIKSFIIGFFTILIIYMAVSCQPGYRYRADRRPGDDLSENSGRYSRSPSNIDSFISEWLGTPYKYGGLSKRGVDCSGFVYLLMLHVYNKKIPRISQNQYRKGRKIMRSRLQKGDLVFFKRVRSRGIDHVGVYLGDNSFAHASVQKGVIISSLSEEYYNKRYAGACRY